MKSSNILHIHSFQVEPREAHFSLWKACFTEPRNCPISDCPRARRTLVLKTPRHWAHHWDASPHTWEFHCFLALLSGSWKPLEGLILWGTLPSPHENVPEGPQDEALLWATANLWPCLFLTHSPPPSSAHPHLPPPPASPLNSLHPGGRVLKDQVTGSGGRLHVGSPPDSLQAPQTPPNLAQSWPPLTEPSPVPASKHILKQSFHWERASSLRGGPDNPGAPGSCRPSSHPTGCLLSHHPPACGVGGLCTGSGLRA